MIGGLELAIARLEERVRTLELAVRDLQIGRDGSSMYDPTDRDGGRD